MSPPTSPEVSFTAAVDESDTSTHDANMSPVDERRCAMCRAPLVDVRSRTCGKKCRQMAYRLRKRANEFGPGPRDTSSEVLSDASLCDRADASPADPRSVAPAASVSRRAAYADPPYPGLAHYYRGHRDYAGEVDHTALVRRLRAEFDGWALSTSSAALRHVLPLCPPTVRVCAWLKPLEPSPHTHGLHSRWEPVLVVPVRRLQPGVRDWLIAAPAHGGHEKLVGRKPIAFCAWLFHALGLQPGDELEDLFPGTGIVASSWAELSRPGGGDVSRLEPLHIAAARNT